MKITLPILLLLAINMQAQSYLYALNGNANANNPQQDGVIYRMYEMYVPETVFDQSAAGFDKTWDISAFTTIPNQSKYYMNSLPTADEQIEFQGATIKTSGYLVTLETII
ncbi:hypothetical protein [Flavobacterium sp. 3HN19-14]|uniref:hypothetical protein n=1 Tax=Flavobacterium sp. 3HN19-14 TaxID=3448133 RepID=UPI003EDF1EB3